METKRTNVLAMRDGILDDLGEDLDVGLALI